MVSRPDRRIAPDTPTPFADAALDLCQHGLAVLPLGGDDGKVPLVKWAYWKYRPGRDFLESLTEKYPTANVGILTGLSRVTVVDIDDPALVDAMVARFGDTPLQTSTPRGGVHLWYRSNGERSRVRLDDLKVDIRGLGGMVVVPPSIRPTGQYAGKRYAFLTGSWADLANLPPVNPGALPAPAPRAEPSPPVPPDQQVVRKGVRDITLFLACLDQAPHCGTLDELVAFARDLNASYEPPMNDVQVVQKAHWTWKIDRDGQNLVANRGQGSKFMIPDRWIDMLLAYDEKHGPDALALYAKLREKHGARDKRGKTFAIAARAMVRDQVLPWTEPRIRLATKVLVDCHLLARPKKGGRFVGDASQYRFRSPPPSLVSKNNTNAIRQPGAVVPGGKGDRTVESDNVMTASSFDGMVA